MAVRSSMIHMHFIPSCVLRRGGSSNFHKYWLMRYYSPTVPNSRTFLLTLLYYLISSPNSIIKLTVNEKGYKRHRGGFLRKLLPWTGILGMRRDIGRWDSICCL